MSPFLGGKGLAWAKQNLPRIPLLVNLAWGLFRDPRVPVSLKAVLLGVLAYVASPLDLIPDFIPVLGRVDDLLVLLAAMEMFTRLAPPEVVAEIEEKYREGHGPLRTDLEAAEKHLGRLWTWAVPKVERLAQKYKKRVDNEAFVRDVKGKTPPPPSA